MKLLVLALLLAVGSVSGADQNKPHPHTGKLTPFKLGKPDVTLKPSEFSKVDAGEMFKTQTMSADGLSGCSTAVQSVAAPPKVIWGQLLDFKTYTKKVEKLPECKVYSDKPMGMGNRQIKVMMKINAAPGFNYVSYYDHTYSAKDKSLIWTLDYERDSDFDDVTGHWYVTEHPTQKDCSYVYYSADLKLKQWVPKFVLNILNNVALAKAVEWVKRESEEEWKRTPKAGATASGLGFPKVPSFSGFGKPPPAPVVVAPPPPKKLPAKKVAAIAGSAGAFTAAAVAVGIKIAEWGDDE